ncbi:MAG: hypothetical protein II829_03230 [Bacteroidales bacterium]|nr:hypothetical protein [Bacteroidales bacterium]MBQ4398583.1 hypothetical protein [Bacteroidales bacterium]
MKKLFLSLLLFAQIVSYGQSFDFVHGVGIRSAQDRSKGYIVFDFPGMSASDIRAAVVAKIPTIYDYSTGSIQNGENNSISLIASTGKNELFIDNNYSRYQAAGSPKGGVGGDFIMNIYFKDGRVRYDAPTFQRLYLIAEIVRGHFNRTDCPNYGDDLTPFYELIKNKEQQNSTVQYFNNLVRALNKAIEEAASKPSDW